LKNKIIAVFIFALAFMATAQNQRQLDSIRALSAEQQQRRSAVTTNETFPGDDEMRRTSRMLDSMRLVDSLRTERLREQDPRRLAEGDTVLTDTVALIYDESAIEFVARERLTMELLDSMALQPFGGDFFRIAQELLLVPNIGPVNADYVLGVGDEIIIQIWGDVQYTESFLVGRNGTISPRGIGQVNLAGRTLREARQTLIQRYSRIYSGVRNGAPNATTFIDITTGTLRQKSIIVVGEVETPGNFLIPSTAGLVHAIARAGGPTDNASLRNVTIRRRGAANIDAVDTVDLYNFFLKGIITDTVTLSDFDVVLLNPVEKYVHVTGAVRRPGRYELREGETFADLIRFAGGFLPEAHTQNILIERTTIGQQRQNYTIAEEQLERVFPKSNDFVTIEFVDKVNNTVSIEGAVERPGLWGFNEGMRISDLINIAGGVLEEFFGDRIVVIRTQENFEKEILAVTKQSVSDGTNDLLLQKWDVVRVFSIWDLQFHRYIDIFGMVTRPGRYFLREGMTVQDIILLAGGFDKGAYRNSIEISRILSQDPDRGNTTQPTRINISTDFFKESTHILQHQDVVFVRENVTESDQEIIYLGGEFLFPGHYAKLTRNETLTQIIRRAGGFTESAFLDGTIFIRSRDSLGQVAIDFENLFNTNLRRRRDAQDIILEHGDSIIASTNPRTVVVDGSVNSPATVRFVERRPVSHYVNRAGGLTLDGQRGVIYVIRANGEVREVRRMRDRNIVNSGSRLFAVDGPPPRERQPQLVFAALTALTTTMTATATLLSVLNR